LLLDIQSKTSEQVDGQVHTLLRGLHMRNAIPSETKKCATYCVILHTWHFGPFTPAATQNLELTLQ
jgi:hypothetical protein